MLTGKGLFLEVVVLAVKTVKGTGMVEDSQVLVSVFWTFCIGITRISTARARRAHKTGHTISWQGVIVKGEFSLVGPASLQLPVPDMTETAKTCPAF
jgi:hypothetical protein